MSKMILNCICFLGLYSCIHSKVVENMIDFLKQTVLYAENTGNNPFGDVLSFTSTLYIGHL